ncbi:MAG: hypothetical protein AB9Q22_02945 [Candidatus Reddybacter sp.]
MTISVIGGGHADDLHDSYSWVYRGLEKLGVSQGDRQGKVELSNPPMNISIRESVIQRMD